MTLEKNDEKLIRAKGQLLITLLESNCERGLSREDQTLAFRLIDTLPKTGGKCVICKTCGGDYNKLHGDKEIGYTGYCRNHARYCLRTRK